MSCQRMQITAADVSPFRIPVKFRTLNFELKFCPEDIPIIYQSQSSTLLPFLRFVSFFAHSTSSFVVLFTLLNTVVKITHPKRKKEKSVRLFITEGFLSIN